MSKNPNFRKYYANFMFLASLVPSPASSSASDEPQMTHKKVGLRPTKWYSQHERENPRTLHRRTPPSLTRAHTPQRHRGRGEAAHPHRSKKEP